MKTNSADKLSGIPDNKFYSIKISWMMSLLLLKFIFSKEAEKVSGLQNKPSKEEGKQIQRKKEKKKD